jgi:hypothetical protein
MVAMHRLMISEAERAGIGRLFYEKMASIRGQVASFLAKVMEEGKLGAADAGLAASQLRALLEAELLEPLLLLGCDGLPEEADIALASERAVDTFMRAYAVDAHKQ